MYQILEKYGSKIEWIILILLILLNILEFSNLLTEYTGYIDKVLDFTALGYILYKIDLTKILFGTSHRNMDLLLIGSYFMLSIKDVIAFSALEVKEAVNLHPFYQMIVTNGMLIETTGFYIGAIAIILIALYYTFFFPVKAPSLMHVIHEEGMPPRKAGKLSIRFLTIFIVLVAFFVMVVNLMIEWLAVAVDAPIAVAIIFFFIFHTRKFKADTFIYKVGNASEEFYQKFVTMFKFKHTLMLGIAGMLILHLLTDIGNFILPYTLALEPPMYFSQIDGGHIPLMKLFAQGITQNIASNVGLGLIYLLNVIGALLLLALPAYFWYDTYIGKKIGLPKALLGVFASSITVLLLKPAFKLEEISSSSMAGVNILTQAVQPTDIVYTLLVALFFGVLTFAVSFRLKRQIEMIGMFIALIFCGFYFYHFFANLFHYYVTSIISLATGITHIFIAIFLFLFLIITILFYIGGFFIFVKETVKSYFAL